MYSHSYVLSQYSSIKRRKGKVIIETFKLSTILRNPPLLSHTILHKTHDDTILNKIARISIPFHFYLELTSPRIKRATIADGSQISLQSSCFPLSFSHLFCSSVSTCSFNPLFRSKRAWLHAHSFPSAKGREEKKRRKKERKEECKSSLTSPSNIRFRIEWEFQSEPPTTQISFIASKRLRSVVCLNCYT